MSKPTKKILGGKKPSKTRKNRKPLKKNKRKNIKKGGLGLFGLFETDYYSKLFNDKGCYKVRNNCDYDDVKKSKNELIDLVAIKDSKKTYTLIEKKFKVLNINKMKSHIEIVANKEYAEIVRKGYEDDIEQIGPEYCKKPQYEEDVKLNELTEKQVFNRIVNKYNEKEAEYCMIKKPGGGFYNSDIVLFVNDGKYYGKTPITRKAIRQKLVEINSFIKDGFKLDLKR